MTRRERLEAIIRGEISEELIADCKRELEKLNERGAAVLAKSKETAQYKENKAYEERIYGILKERPETMQVDELRSLVAPELSRQRVTAICTNLVREGRIGVTDLKIKGKGIRKGYFVERV